MSELRNVPSATDLLAVKSRVSWGAIIAGAMISLTIYVVLSLLGLALGVELAVRGGDRNLGAGAAIYSIVTLLLSLFFGGWATSRLAVGESKLEAVLYGMILWGVFFLGLIWLLGTGVRTGFGAMVGVASGAYTADDGQVDAEAVTRNLKQAGFDEATVNKYRSYYDRLKNNPGAAGDVGRDVKNDPEVQQTARQAADGARATTWWTLLGVLVSVATVIVGSLMGSGELLQPVPILGVRRVPRV